MSNQKRFKLALRLCGLFANFGSLQPVLAADAPRIVCDGVLGNSGEQGSTLIRFGPKSGRNGASGVGVVYDRLGTLWTRAGEGVINRYSLDGRLLQSRQLPAKFRGLGNDQITLVGDTLVLSLKNAVLTLPITSEVNAPFTPLKNLKPNCISWNSHDGFLAAADDAEIFVFNVATGERRSIAKVESLVRGIDMTADGTIVISQDNKLRSFAFADGKEITPTDKSRNVPGDRMRFIDGALFGGQWHATLRRYNANGDPDPGVVLGGNSGSFIGHVDENPDVEMPRGLAKVRDDMLAICGMNSVVQLMTWQPATQRYAIVRRIGALPACNALAIDHNGSVWCNAGMWRWTDGPDVPMRQGMSPSDPPAGPAATIDGTIAVVPTMRAGKFFLMHGLLEDELRTTNVQLTDSALPAARAGVAVYTADKVMAVMIVDAHGFGQAIRLGRDGAPGGNGGAVELKAEPRIHALTSLTSLPNGKLLATADGAVIEFGKRGTVWQESGRWSSWGTGDADHFGNVIHATGDGQRLWVSDSNRQRVLVFYLSGPAARLLATFGKTDTAGDDMATMQQPATLAACGDRAVVHDAANQRLLKLRLNP